MKSTFATRNFLQALFIMLIGFLLFNLAFILVAAILSGISMITHDPAQNNTLGFMIFMILLIVMTWFIFQTKLSVLLKASFFTMPVMSVIVMVGVLLFGQERWVLFGVEGFIIGLILYFLRLKRLSWQYTFALAYCVLLGIIISLFNVQI